MHEVPRSAASLWFLCLAIACMLLLATACNPFDGDAPEETVTPGAAPSTPIRGGHPRIGDPCFAPTCDLLGDVFSQVSCMLGTLTCAGEDGPGATPIAAERTPTFEASR